MNNTAIIILAAGNSSRLGTPKQLLLYKNKPLLLHTVDAATEANLFPVIIITGHLQENTIAILSGQNVKTIHNYRWQEGMATGISLGIKEILLQDYPVANVIISVCDQPYIDGLLFKKMMKAQVDNDKPIVACSYAGIIGVPVLFSNKYFNELLDLDGTEGAKKLLNRYKEDVCVVDFPLGKTDIDTIEDYENLIK